MGARLPVEWSVDFRSTKVLRGHWRIAYVDTWVDNENTYIT